MRFFSPLFALAGILIFFYALIGRFLGGLSLFGFEAENIIMVANSFFLIAILFWLYGAKKTNHK
jgi:hypothetical protein